MDYKFEIISHVHSFILANKLSNANELVENLKRELGDKFEKHIFQLNTPCHIIVFGEGKNKFVVKLERNSHPTTTQKEIAWYSYISEHNIPTANLPKFYGGYQDEGVAFYFLEYLEDYVSAGDALVDGTMTSQELSKLATDAMTAVENMFHALPRKKDSSIVRQVFAERLQKRFNEMFEFDYLKEMLSWDEVIINGKSYKNLPFFIERLINHPLLREIENKELGIIHGDMHFGNILIKKGASFMFLDPNGALFLPLEYDYSKILYSTMSGHNFLRKGKYLVRQDENRFDFDLDGEKIREKITKDYVEFLGNRAKTVFYTNAIHSISALPHHAKEKEEEVAKYLQTILVLNDLLPIL